MMLHMYHHMVYQNVLKKHNTRNTNGHVKSEVKRIDINLFK